MPECILVGGVATYGDHPLSTLCHPGGVANLSLFLSSPFPPLLAYYIRLNRSGLQSACIWIYRIHVSVCSSVSPSGSGPFCPTLSPPAITGGTLMQPSEKITPRCIAGTMAEQCYRSYRPMREKLIAREHTR